MESSKMVQLLQLSRFSRVRLCVPHRRQPTRLPYPWDSPGKNTGVGCHFLLQSMKVKSESEVAQSPLTLCDRRLPQPWDSPGKNTGVGCHFLPQCMKVKSESEVTQSRLTLCDPTDGSPPGSPIPGIFQARALERVAIAFFAKTVQMDLFSGKE